MGHLIRVAADRANRPADVVAPGATVELRYPLKKTGQPLSLNAAKMLHLSARAAGLRLGEHVKHEVLLSEIRLAGHRTIEEIRDATHQLVTTSVEVRQGNATVYGPVWDYAKVDDEASGKLVFRYSEAMLEVLRSDDRWAVLSRQCVIGFQSRYGLRLYEVLSLRRDLTASEVTIELDDLRERLGVPKGKLKTYSDLRVYAIDIAVREVTELTDLTVRYEPIKKGRAVTAVRLSWRVRKAAAAIAEAAPRPPAGFPAGTIAFSSPWREIARQHGGGWDVDIIAVAFRETDIPLRGPKVESAFTGFCKAFVARRGPQH